MMDRAASMAPSCRATSWLRPSWAARKRRSDSVHISFSIYARSFWSNYGPSGAHGSAYGLKSSGRTSPETMHRSRQADGGICFSPATQARADRSEAPAIFAISSTVYPWRPMRATRSSDDDNAVPL